MNKPPAHLTPALGVVAADDNDISWHAQIAQRAMEAHRLLGLVINLGLNDKKVDIATGTGLSASMGTKQNDLRVRSSRNQAPSGLSDQGLVNYLHSQIVIGISDHPANRVGMDGVFLGRSTPDSATRRWRTSRRQALS